MLVRNGYLGPTAQSLCLKYLLHESRHKQICVYTGRALMLVARPYNPRICVARPVWFWRQMAGRTSSLPLLQLLHGNAYDPKLSQKLENSAAIDALNCRGNPWQTCLVRSDHACATATLHAGPAFIDHRSLDVLDPSKRRPMSQSVAIKSAGLTRNSYKPGRPGPRRSMLQIESFALYHRLSWFA
jgi:hypothetical protein